MGLVLKIVKIRKNDGCQKPKGEKKRWNGELWFNGYTALQFYKMISYTDGRW